MSYPRHALHNIPAAPYANLPSSANATLPAFTESGAGYTTSSLLINNGARALAAPQVVTHPYHHIPTPVVIAYSTVAFGGTPSPAGSTRTGAFFGDNETEEPQTPTTEDVPSPSSSELVGSLFGGDSDDADDEGEELQTLGVNAAPSDAEGLPPNVRTSYNPPTLLDERPPPTISYPVIGFDGEDRQELYDPEAAPQSLGPTAYHHNDHPSLNQYQQCEHPATSDVMPMVPAPPSFGMYVYNTPTTQPPYRSPVYPTNAIQPHHPSTRAVAGSSHAATNTHISSPSSWAAAKVPLLSTKAAGKRRAEHTPTPEPAAPSQESYSTALAPTAESGGSWQSTMPPPPSKPQGSNKRKHGDEDEIDGQTRRPAPFQRVCGFCSSSFTELEQHQLTCDQNFHRFTEPEHRCVMCGSHVIDSRNHLCQGQQQQVPTNNLPSAEASTTPARCGDPSLIGFSKEELQHWLAATEAHYQYSLRDKEELYMCAKQLIVTTSQLVGAFSQFRWLGPEALHIYHGFNWYPVPPKLPCLNSYLGIRVGVFQTPSSSEFRYIPLDIENNSYSTIDEFYYHLMRVNHWVYMLHSRRVLDVTPPGAPSASKPIRGATCPQKN